MKKYYSITIFITTAMFLMGCATTKSNVSFFEEKLKGDNDAIIYVYRLKSMVGAVAPWNVYIDSNVVGVLNQGAYMALHVVPDVPHTLQIGENMFILDFNHIAESLIDLIEAVADNPNAFIVKKNKTYYLRSAGFKVEFLSKEKAMPELSAMKYDMGK